MSSLSDDDFFDRVFSPVFGEGAGAEEEEVGFFVGVVEEGMGGRNRPVRAPHAKSVSHRLWARLKLLRPSLCEYQAWPVAQ